MPKEKTLQCRSLVLMPLAVTGTNQIEQQVSPTSYEDDPREQWRNNTDPLKTIDSLSATAVPEGLVTPLVTPCCEDALFMISYNTSLLVSTPLPTQSAYEAAS